MADNCANKNRKGMDFMDMTLDASFPASDPPSWTPHREHANPPPDQGNVQRTQTGGQA